MNKRAHRQQAAEQAARAAALLRDGRAAEARDLFESALRKHADSYDAQLGLARALLGLEKTQDAEDAFAKAAKLGPDKAEPHLGRARIVRAELDASPTANFHNGAYYSSLEAEDYYLDTVLTWHLDAAVAAEPDNLDARLERGLWSALNGADDKAIDDLRAVHAAAPDDPDTWRAILPGLVNAGDHEFAMQLFDRLDADGHWDAPTLRARCRALEWLRPDARAEADLRALVDLEPDNIDDRRDLAACLRRQKRPEEEVGEWQYIVSLPNADQHDYTSLAVALAALERYAEAEEALTEAIRLAPENGCLYQRRGNMRRLQDHDDDAKADYDQALVFQPKCYTALINRGLLHKRKGDIEAMRADWLEATQRGPRSATVCKSLADHFLSEKMWPECLAHAEAAIEKRPDDAKALSLRGRARFETGDPDNGLNDLDRAVDLAPDNAAIRNQRGIVLGKMGHPDLQIEDCRTALEHAPGDHGILHNLAVRLIDTGQPEEALSIFEDVVTRRGNASDWGWLGQCKRQLGRPAEAIADLEHALTLDENDERIREILAKAREDLQAE